MEKQTRREFLGKTGRGLAGLVLAGGLAASLPSSNGCSGLKSQKVYEEGKEDFYFDLHDGRASQIERRGDKFVRDRKLLSYHLGRGGKEKGSLLFVEERPVNGEDNWKINVYVYKGNLDLLLEELEKKLPCLTKAMREPGRLYDKLIVREIDGNKGRFSGFRYDFSDGKVEVYNKPKGSVYFGPLF